MIGLLAICWVLGSMSLLVGGHRFLKAEHERQRQIDRAVQRAWDVVERELNPPRPPSPQEVQHMMGRMNALSQAASQNANAAYHNAYYSQQGLHNQMLGGMCGPLGLASLFGL